MNAFKSLFGLGDKSQQDAASAQHDAPSSSEPIPPGDKVAQSSQLAEGGRIHVKLQGRYLTILRLNGSLQCIDSICFHAGGPLGIGDIEDLNGRTCIVCPWHYYKIDVETGDKYYQAVSFENGKMVQGEWKSNGVKQRVHKAAEANGSIYVELITSGSIDSDSYACKADCGERVISAPPSRLHSKVGGDGKKSSGSVVQLAREKAEKATASSMSNDGA